MRTNKWFSQRRYFQSTQLSPNAICLRRCTLSLETRRRRDILSPRSVAFGSAECDDRQGQIGLDVTAATSVASKVDLILVPSSG
jgi:hypothetical protein